MTLEGQTGTENYTKTALERTNPYVLKYFFLSLYVMLFVVFIVLLTILVIMLIYCCQKKKIIRRTEKQVSWQNQRRNNKFRKELFLKNALDLKQTQQQYIRYWPGVGDFCQFYFKRLGLPKRLAITIVSQCLDNMLSLYETKISSNIKSNATNKLGRTNMKSKTKNKKTSDCKKRMPSRESNISNNQLKKKSRIKRQNIFKQIMGIIFMAAQSETDRQQLLFFLDQASQTHGAHYLIQKRKSHCQIEGASGAIIAKANRIIKNFQLGRLRQTPSVYELVDYYIQTERQQGQIQQERDVLYEYKMDKFKRESLSMQNLKKNQQDFKWLERYRNYLIISQHLQNLDEFRSQQLDLLLSINQQQDANKYDMTEGQIYFNYLHQQANALWKFIESLFNMNYYDILRKKIQINGRNQQKWNFDKISIGRKEIFIKQQID